MNNRKSVFGRRFGNYRIVAELGSGAYGCTYLAQHMHLDRIAAIKLLHAARLASEKERGKFLQEARILDSLRHPSILPMYDFGIDADNFPYLITEYAPNGSLRDLLDLRHGRPLPTQQALSILSQVGKALFYTHRQGIIHHDVKPENILFNAQGKVLLADFGTAMIQQSPINWRDSSIIGTPSYMAPEQFRGQTSRRSDQYSTACVGYELFTGHKPFIARNAIALGMMHVHDQPLDPSRFNPSIPVHIEQALLKGMEKRRINRFEDMHCFIAALYNRPPVPTLPVQLVVATQQKTKEQWIQEAATLRRLKRYDEALFADEQAIQLDPGFATSHNNKGNTLYYLQRFHEALAAYQRALLLDPNFALAYCNKAISLKALGRYEEALAAIERAIALDNAFDHFYYHRSKILELLGRDAEASQAAARAEFLSFQKRQTKYDQR
jgi:serine/threonine protein kinase